MTKKTTASTMTGITLLTLYVILIASPSHNPAKRRTNGMIKQCCGRCYSNGDQGVVGARPGCWCCWRGALTTEQLGFLDDEYDFVDGEFGPFFFAQNWQSDDCPHKDPTNAYVIVLDDGICGRWSEWQEDRFYHIHEGRVLIDTISPDGELVTECLGSPIIYPGCQFTVRIPAGWISDIRVDGSLAILTSVIIHGDNTGGINYSYESMLETYPEYAQVIQQTERCYQV